MDTILSLIIWMPLALGLVLTAMDPKRLALLRWTALVISLLDLAACVWLVAHFQAGQAGMQFTQTCIWIPAWGISYSIGVDGISVFLILLTAVLVPISLLASWKAVQVQVREFLLLILAMETALHGVFLARDVFLFYLFWEATLIPMYFLIGVWGGERRIYATIKFVLYTLTGSVLMLAAILVLYFQVHAKTGIFTFDLAAWTGMDLPFRLQAWLFAAFFTAFAVKVPLFPFHTWLPDAHVEAPTAGSILLAGVLLKMGSYGILRYCQPLFPVAMVYFQPWLSLICLVGILYGAAMVLVQTDFKKMVAYSSVSHMGLCILGIVSLKLEGQQGGLLTMVNHGISTGALFLCVGIFYERTHTRDLALYGGAVQKMPVMGLLFLPVALSSMGVPGTNGFVNEFMVLWGTFKYQKTFAALAALGIILSAAYMLRMVQKVMLGPSGSEKMEHLWDLDFREKIALGTLVALVFAIGVFPGWVLSMTEPAVNAGLVGMVMGRP